MKTNGQPLLVAALCAASFLSPATRAFAQSISDTTSGPAATAPSPADTDTATLPDAPAAHQTAPFSNPVVPLDQQPHPEATVRLVPKHIAFDLGHIFLSPLYIRTGDLKYLAPIAGATALTLETDTRVNRDVVSHDVDFNDAAGNASDGLRDLMIVIPVGLFTLGSVHHDEHQRETGILASEAMVDAFVFDEVVKFATFRERPYVDNYQGRFYRTNAGIDSSFISGHSIIAWSSAAVIADEYHSPWVRLGVYTLATGTAVNRVLGEQHFPTDVLLGSASGWLIGHYVYRAHHHFNQVHKDKGPIR